MKRAAFARPGVTPRPEKQWTAEERPGPRVPMPAAELRIPDGRARMVISLPKNPPLRSETYRRYVASQSCAHCGRAGPSQCAHGDEGKGLAIKASDETCFALCADGPGRQGCHSLIGASGKFTRDQRRTLERTYGYDAKLRAISDGQWPDGWK